MNNGAPDRFLIDLYDVSRRLKETKVMGVKDLTVGAERKQR